MANIPYKQFAAERPLTPPKDGQMVDYFPLVYDELRALAGHYFQGERRDHTLQPTALVHEAYLRLAREDRSEPKNRQQFFAIAATFMRRILVNHAKSHSRIKRGGNLARVPLDQFPETSTPLQPPELLALDSAIGRLAKIDARKASIVELRYFAGLTISEVADILESSPATVKRDWLFAKTWLLREIKDSE